MTPIIIELAGQPQGKARPRFRIMRSRGGQTFGQAYTAAKTQTYEAALRTEAALVMCRELRETIEGPVAVKIIAFMQIPKSWSRKKREAAMTGEIRPTTKPDYDNVGKQVDALNGVVWHDDKQIVEAVIIKTYSDNPRLRIEVSEILPE